MAKQLYGYGSSYGGPGLSSAYASRAGGGEQYLADGSLVGSSRYLGPDLSMVESAQYVVTERSPSPYLSQNESLNYSASQVAGAEGYSSGKYSGGIGGASMPSLYSQFGVMDSSLLPGMKRSSEALFHQTLLGNHNSIGQNEALFSTNPLLKRPRFEIGSHLPIYPQRPGEKDCAHYMLTRTCKFGDNCKFDHPLWVPEGGIPDWKEVPVVNTPESLPERPGEPDCPYFMKTQRCKFGPRCKFNHPKDKPQVSEMADVSVLPERPSEPICSYYAKTGKCKFGANCIFHHPKDIQLPSSGQDPVSGEHTETTVNDGEANGESKAGNPLSFAPAMLHNSKGLPVRPGEQDCPFYLKTGSCKYGATCRYNHPDRNAFNPIAASAFLHSPSTNLSIGVVNPAVSLLSNIDTRFSQTTLGVGPILYPQRPGQTECDFYMKTGQCKFGVRCKFHHPVDRSALASSVLKPSAEQNIKLTPAGLPRREGAVICPYYLKTGTCRFGPSCKFDHPTPAEAIAMAAAKDASASDATAQGEEVEDPVQDQAPPE